MFWGVIVVEQGSNFSKDERILEHGGFLGGGKVVEAATFLHLNGWSGKEVSAIFGRGDGLRCVKAVIPLARGNYPGKSGHDGKPVRIGTCMVFDLLGY